MAECGLLFFADCAWEPVARKGHFFAAQSAKKPKYFLCDFFAFCEEDSDKLRKI
jgi:hypothetical protein